jgi:ribosomal protein S18 acetylase RimI-like enzyme
MGSEQVRVRSADPTDRALIVRATVANLNWHACRFTADDVLGNPAFAHYVTSFHARGDFGFVAADDDGPVGVCWTVLTTAADPGFGYVADDVPEVCLTVFDGFRRRGIGRMLLSRTVDEAVARGFEAVSLSVEDANPARGLYASAGFAVVGRSGGSETMLRRLR